jgi:predicted cobalt transporter CbtA
MIIARLAMTGILAGLVVAGLAGYSAPAKAEPVLLRCEKFQDSTIGASVVFARVDPDKNDVFLKTHADQAWKVFKDVKHADDIIQINEKSWVDRATGVLKWDFSTYQCQTARSKVF